MSEKRDECVDCGARPLSVEHQPVCPYCHGKLKRAISSMRARARELDRLEEVRLPVSETIPAVGL